MKPPITPMQYQALLALDKVAKHSSEAPSSEEVAIQLGESVAVTEALLQELTELGFVSFEKGGVH